MQRPRLKTTHPLGEYTLPIPQAQVRIALWNSALGKATPISRLTNLPGSNS